MKGALAGLCLFLASPAIGGEAVYVVSGAEPVPAAANGYHQQVRILDDGEFEVRVVVSVSPIGSTGSYARVLAESVTAVPEGFELPAVLAQRLGPELSAWEAATVVLEWVSGRVENDPDDNGPQDARSVLRRGRGRCSGVSNASVALLRAAGFDARTVSGVLVGDDEIIPHRWLEVRLPAAGWVPGDPTLGLWTVTPSHLVFADTVTQTPSVRVVQSARDGLARLPKRKGRLLRPNLGAELVCRLQTAPAGPAPTAVLRGSGDEVRRARLDPEARFSGLLPGRWLLEVEADGRILERRALVLRQGGFHSYTITASSEWRRPEPGS